MDWTYLTTMSQHFNERNDCSVKAVALVTDQPYAHVHALFLKEGRKPRRGTPWYITLKVLRRLGFELKDQTPHVLDLIRVYYGRRLASVTPKGVEMYGKALAGYDVAVMRCRGHVLGVRDGKPVDWTKGRRHRCRFFALVPVD